MSDSTFDITDTFSEPFYTGTGAEADEWALPVGIDGRGFLLDLQSDQFSRRSVDLLNTQDARSGNTLSAPPEVWRREFESWHQGADQDRFDRDDSMEFRFHRSIGIDPWKKHGFELLHDVDTLVTLGTGGLTKLEALGRALLVSHGDTSRVYPDVVEDADTFTDQVMPGDVVDTTGDGENFYVLSDNGAISRWSSVSGTWNLTWATVSGLDPAKAMIEFVKGFLVVGNGPELWDYTKPATPVEVYTHRLDGWSWRAACEGLTVVYVLGGMGDRWHVHRVGIKDTAVGLDPPIVAASLPEGEVAYDVASYLGYVLIGCSTGWRFGMPDQSGAVTYGQLIETPSPVRCFEGQGRFVWFGLSQEQTTAPVQARNEARSIYTDFAGLGRADLSTFVAPMTPAAASDLRGVDLGITTDVVTVGGELDGEGWRVMAITPVASPSKVFIEVDRLVTEGTLRSGLVSFNSNDSKMGLYAQATHEPLKGEVVVAVYNDAIGETLEIGYNDAPDTITLRNMPYPVSFSTVEFVVTLRSTADRKFGPRMSRMEIRAINVPGRATEWRIPLLLAQDITVDNLEQTRSVANDYDFIMELVQSRRLFIYREGERRWRLHATDFIWQPHNLTQAKDTYSGTMLLVAREYG